MAAPHLVHCSYHKCLTVYYKRVFHALFNLGLPWGRAGRRGYRHYNSHLDDFHGDFRKRRVTSVNNHALDLERLGHFRVSRFLRDPRDLVVSGYFYHRRGAEPWTLLESPTAEDWCLVNGRVPDGLRARNEASSSSGGMSFASYLRSLSEEGGLLAELEFRRGHFDSMAQWPDRHSDILTFRYEEIVGDEARVFRELFAFYGLSPLERALGSFFVRRYSIRKVRADPHVRDPAAGQWRRHFTPRVRRAFDERHAGLVERLGYPTD